MISPFAHMRNGNGYTRSPPTLTILESHDSMILEFQPLVMSSDSSQSSCRVLSGEGAAAWQVLHVCKWSWKTGQEGSVMEAKQLTIRLHVKQSPK